MAEVSDADERYGDEAACIQQPQTPAAALATLTIGERHQRSKTSG